MGECNVFFNTGDFEVRILNVYMSYCRDTYIFIIIYCIDKIFNNICDSFTKCCKTWL